MIVPSIEEVRKLDQLTIENEPIPSIDLMERASRGFCERFLDLEMTWESILVVCGPGNNGGDGLAIARILHERSLNVDISIINPKKGTEDFKINLNRLPKGMKIYEINGAEGLKDLPKYPCVIDGIFGSGLSRAAGGVYKEAIDWINDSGALVVSIDIPSGMFGDNANISSDPIVKADHTFSFQFPKLSFFMPYQGSLCGKVSIIDIGILEKEIAKLEPKYKFFDLNDARHARRKRKKFSHKGSYGHGLLISGSKGKMGAAALAGRAALRSGIGLLTIHAPKAGVAVLQETLNEAMVSEDRGEDAIISLPDLEKFDVLAVGPGLGTGAGTTDMMAELLKEWNSPMVIDADGLNIISGSPELIKMIPQGTILTPHPGEFRRLVGNWEDDYDRMEKQKEFSRKYNAIVVLKGANTAVTDPGGNICFNSTGNPGMATAGSGDVLTGIIFGLLAQGYEPDEAACLGVFLHGLSGDLFLEQSGPEGLIASDLIENLGRSFSELS